MASEDEQFFESREEIPSVYCWASDCSEDCSSSVVSEKYVSNSFLYDVWNGSPESVRVRRSRFLRWMGLSLDQNFTHREELVNESFDNLQLGIDTVLDDSREASRMSVPEDGIFSTPSSMSQQSYEARESTENGVLDILFRTRIKNLDNGMEFVVDKVGQDGMLSRLRKVGSNRSLSLEEFQRTIGSSPLVQRFFGRYVDEAKDTVEERKKAKKSLLGKLRATVWTAKKQGDAALKPKDFEATVEASVQRVKVQSSNKRFKELSSLYAGQEFLAHKGSILTMKFSLDGLYLATGGEDGVVRVWKVIEDDRLDQFEILASDPSCVYFTMNDHSKLGSIDMNENKIGKKKGSTCVVFPPKTFRVSEKPLQEFQGHCGEVLDLAWSDKRLLLSSSNDNTVRLWQVGCDRCLRVFAHNNYVTCVDFNPADDNYFISGSIDGKVRIWEVLGCQVVDHTDIREIVTAVCYRPGGKGGIVGTMAGNCYFYDIIDNQLQLDAQICLQGKKKLAGKRITSFEFSPSDPSKVVVTSADSLVRVLCGIDVVCKYKASGLRVAANQMFASFTSDGKHIVSTSEDTNVYIWNYSSQEKTSRVKNIQSCESFVSQNALIAIPWRGIENEGRTFLSPESTGNIQARATENVDDHNISYEESDPEMPQTSPDCFSRTRGLLLELLKRESATWPEEKLPDTSPPAVSPRKWKSEFKFLKNACQSMLSSSSHMWGLVIVTAGWDGRIRTYLNYGLPLRL